MRSRARLWASLLLGTALAAPAGAGELWQWTDEQGVVRYTPQRDRVPAGQRDSLVKVEPGAPEPAEAPAAASRTPVIYAPPDEIDFEADPFNAPERARDVRVEPVPPTPTASQPAPTPTASQPAPPPTAAQPVSQPAPPPRPETRPLAPESPNARRQPAPAPAATAPAAAEPPAPAPVDAPPAAAVASAPTPQPAAAGEATAGARAATGDPYAAYASVGTGSAGSAAGSADTAARRAELEREIAAQEAALKDLISRPADGTRLEDTPEFREIARRLPELQAELRELDAAQAPRAQAPPAAP